MSNEKTALELVDELCGLRAGTDGCVRFDWVLMYSEKIKSAIERERDKSESECEALSSLANERGSIIGNLESQVKAHTRTIQDMNDRLKSAIEREREQSATAQQILDAVSITAHLSKSQREGESLVGWVKRMTAAEDQLKSAITMRPISELPDRVPDGCVVVQLADYAISSANSANPLHKENHATHFYILPLPPALERKLHPCYFPWCKGKAEAVKYSVVGREWWRVVCLKCGVKGREYDTKEESEAEWGYAE